MKATTSLFFATLGVLFSITVISSCSKAKTLEGAWEASPVRLDVPGTSDGTVTVTIDFGTPAQSASAGNVTLSAVINIDEAVLNTAPGIEQPWQTSISATATITGRYVASEEDDDDILLNLDPYSLVVNVDPAVVNYDQNLLTDQDTEALDSINAAAVSRWRIALSNVMRQEFARYTKIEDIEIHNGDVMTAEIEDHDCTFRRVGTQPVE